VHGDIRLFADSQVSAGSMLTVELRDGEGALLYPLDGELSVDEGPALVPGNTLIHAPSAGKRAITLSAQTDTRLLRVVHGQGRGVVTGRPMVRRGR
jgi:hypothetical protein